MAKFLKITLPIRYQNHPLVSQITADEWQEFVEFALDSLINNGTLYAKIIDSNDNTKSQIAETEKKQLEERIINIQQQHAQEIQSLKLQQKQALESLREKLDLEKSAEIKEKQQEFQRTQGTHDEIIRALRVDKEIIEREFYKKVEEEKNKLKIQMEEEYERKKQLAIKESIMPLQLKYSEENHEKKEAIKTCERIKSDLERETKRAEDINKEYISLQKSIQKTIREEVEREKSLLNENYTVQLQQLMEKIDTVKYEITNDMKDENTRGYGTLMGHLEQLVKRFNDFNERFNIGTSHQKGEIGEKIVYQYLVNHDKYKSGVIKDTSSDVSNGDIRLEFVNIRCLIEIKNKQRIVKSDIDKFHNDIEKQSGNINCALFVSLKTTDIMENMHSEFNYGKIRGIPVIYIGGVLSGGISMISMALQYFERLPNSEDDKNIKNNKLMGFLKMLKEQLEIERQKIKKRLIDIVKEQKALETERTVVEKKLDEIAVFEDEDGGIKVDEMDEKIMAKKIDAAIEWIGKFKKIPDEKYYEENFGGNDYGAWVDMIKKKGRDIYKLTPDMSKKMIEFIKKEKRMPMSRELYSAKFGMRDLLGKLSPYVDNKPIEYLRGLYGNFMADIEKRIEEIEVMKSDDIMRRKANNMFVGYEIEKINID
jgi:hypothetical protein